MKSILLKLDAETLRLVDRYVPRRDRKRSEFIRNAVRRELDRLIEAEMEAPYRHLPQQPDEGWSSPDEWSPAASANEVSAGTTRRRSKRPTSPRTRRTGARR